MKKVEWVLSNGKPLRAGHVINYNFGIISIKWDIKNPYFLPLYSNYSELEVETFKRLGHIRIEEGEDGSDTNR